MQRTKAALFFKCFIVDGYSVKWRVESIWNESQKSSQENKAKNKKKNHVFPELFEKEPQR